jgi:hypothetical protein
LKIAGPVMFSKNKNKKEGSRLPFSMRRTCPGLAILLGAMFTSGLILRSSSPFEIYKYSRDKDGVVYSSSTQDAKKDLELEGERVQFRLGPDFEKYDQVIRKIAEGYNVDRALVKAVIKVESNFNPTAVARAGAKGLMQLMPGTASILGVNDSFNPEENIRGGVRHLRYLLDLFKGDLQMVLAGYNAGENMVFLHHGIPPLKETQIYVQRVLRHFQDYSSESRTTRTAAAKGDEEV